MFSEARCIHEEVSSTFTVSRTMMREGRCRIDAGESPAAERLLRQALATFDELSLPEMCADAEAQLARIRFALNPSAGGTRWLAHGSDDAVAKRVGDRVRPVAESELGQDAVQEVLDRALQ